MQQAIADAAPAFLQIVLLLGFIIPCVFFFLTEQNTLKLIQPLNRTMQPGQVWLQLIPIYGLFYQFTVVARISDSLQREFDSYFNDSDSILPDVAPTGISSGKRPTYSAGMTYCWLFVVSTVARWLPSFLSIAGGLAGIAGIVYLVIYWVQLAGYKKKLQGLRPV